jgi:hypothetical protein
VLSSLHAQLRKPFEEAGSATAPKSLLVIATTSSPQAACTFLARLFDSVQA